MNRMEQEYMILWSRYSCRLVLSSIDFLRLCREKKTEWNRRTWFCRADILVDYFFRWTTSSDIWATNELI